MPDPDLKYVHVDLVDGIATVRIDDPNDENYVKHSHPMHRELRDTFPKLGADPEVKAMVLLGGENEFYPVPQMASLDAIMTAKPGIEVVLQREARDIVRGIIDFPKPLVAGVGKVAHGMGAQIAFLSDFVVASRDVTFQDTHTRLGLTSGDGGTLIWPLVLGLARARRYVLRGHPLSAVEAEELGVVAELVDSADDVPAAATKVAQKLVAIPSLAFETTKFALNQWLRLGATVSLEAASALEVSSYYSPEFQAQREKARGGE
jgi:enoyl-CoA hydratase